MKSMLLYLNEDTYKELKEYAEQNHVSLTTAVADILREYFLLRIAA